MGSISDYAENKLLDHVFGTASFTTPAAIYIGLSTADPTDDGSGFSAPTGGGYARVNITSAFGAASARSITNSAATAVWNPTGGAGGETITHWAIYDASTVGNMLAHGSFTTSKTWTASTTLTIATSQLTVTFSTGGATTYLANKLLDHLLRATTYTQPTVRTALSTADPTDAGSGAAEPGGTYTRIAVATWDAASGGATQNTGTITYPTVDATAWGTITHQFTADAASAGNVLTYGAITAYGGSFAPTNGDTVAYAAGGYDVTLS